jgi:glycosyltransferase involved in cell wall biosynthesis
LEIIVSDDGSTDDTVRVAKTFGKQIVVIKKDSDSTPSGVSGARNRGLEVASFPLCCFLDSDDFYLPGHLSRASEAFEDDPQLGFVFCNTLMNKETSGKQLFKRWTHSPVLPVDVIHPVVSRSFIVTTNAFMFRRELFL